MSSNLDIQQKINQILWGKVLVEVQDCSGEFQTFILRSLTSAEYNRLDFIYRKELSSSLEDGLLPECELAEIYDQQDLWTEKDDIFVRGLKKKIELLKEQIHQFQFMRARRKIAEKRLEKTDKELIDKVAFRNQIFMLSAENRAEEVKRRHMIMMCAEDVDSKPYWNSVDEFLDEQDTALIFNLALAYYSSNVFDQEETREMARSGGWRFRWNAAKKGSDLFGRPISEWSDMQNALVYWSQYYDFVYESAERPSDLVICDDNACDAWYESQIKKMSAKSVGDERTNILGTKRAKTNKQHQEHFIFVEQGDEESVKKVQDMNAASVRVKLRAERKKIEQAAKEGKRLKEWDLRKKEYLVGDMREFLHIKKTKG